MYKIDRDFRAPLLHTIDPRRHSDCCARPIGQIPFLLVTVPRDKAIDLHILGAKHVVEFFVEGNVEFRPFGYCGE